MKLEHQSSVQLLESLSHIGCKSPSKNRGVPFWAEMAWIYLYQLITERRSGRVRLSNMEARANSEVLQLTRFLATDSPES